MSLPVIRMRHRDIDEKHRASTPLELLFDLTFVVAVQAVVTQLAHGIEADELAEALPNFVMVFFAIWWAWLTFTWFASAYDTDDVPYRLLTMLQMGGVLVLAAGVPAAFNNGDFLLITVGYFIMRLALVAQWLRAAIQDPEGRATALRYAAGIAFVQALWIGRLLLVGNLPLPAQIGIFGFLAACELAVPLWAERRGYTRWHPHHIAERYGLFTIILLGESVLAATVGVQAIVTAGDASGEFVLLAASGLALLFGIWWVYYLEPAGEGLEKRRRRSFVWGFGHYFVFAALAALGAGLEVAVQSLSHEAEVDGTTVAYSVAIPVAVFLVAMQVLYRPLLGSDTAIRPATSLVGAAAVLVIPLLAPVVSFGITVLLITLVIAAIITVTVLQQRSRAAKTIDEGARHGV
ncbi:Low temperature requirement protein LtrA [Agreia bicolorata]|uniref:Low temperature requirement protein LtrA n=1 Tax=Agreia bicolorata TaxID=110935 RepID=A0A1T4YDR6_9MICO|nr:low temperature requirement protein A [Agreia bicolorata]SKA99962.1 Low temperature requirement protein LtrA [Agreia bicolorata]